MFMGIWADRVNELRSVFREGMKRQVAEDEIKFKKVKNDPHRVFEKSDVMCRQTDVQLQQLISKYSKPRKIKPRRTSSGVGGGSGSGTGGGNASGSGSGSGGGGSGKQKSRKASVCAADTSDCVGFLGMEDLVCPEHLRDQGIARLLQEMKAEHLAVVIDLSQKLRLQILVERAGMRTYSLSDAKALVTPQKSSVATATTTATCNSRRRSSSSNSSSITTADSGNGTAKKTNEIVELEAMLGQGFQLYSAGRVQDTMQQLVAQALRVARGCLSPAHYANRVGSR
jgi:hypothetical protein